MADVLILAIETATGCGGVALTRGDVHTGTVLAEYTLQPERTHSRQLLGLARSIMAAAGIGWQDLDAVAISRGPGSFTGLRIGMAAAQGLAMAAGVVLIGVPTLDALAAQVTPSPLPLCCLLDARKNQVYCALYRYEGNGWQRQGPDRVLSPAQLVELIKEPTLVVGPGILAAQAELAACGNARRAPAGGLHPRAALVGLCGAGLLAAGRQDQGIDLVPLYVRASEAELDLKRPQRESEQG